MTIPNWYQSLGIDDRIERMERSLESFSSSQNEIMLQGKEMFNQLSTLVETIASKFVANLEGEGSGMRRVADSGRQVSCFISGLRDSIRVDVQANKPTTLTAAIGLARLYEARNTSNRKHVTASPRTIASDSDDDCEMEVDVSGEESNTEHIDGGHAPQTMRLHGSIGKRAVNVLIDFGSTHSFIREMTAANVGLKPVPRQRLEVMVTSGEKLTSPGKCSRTLLNLQDIKLS
ncbi:hypothetical protein POM88_035664 [Heracleum sosnowskyi]|uniref:Uncharacterized protein n=1 Tax=Heracleum sosnowskyi TaxID=360622 RepID=A0AAD8ME50_9APIA|nr:hypothetical protein POM88_035664 [Heracleum sosnowskyi]